jgi:replicative DNA helicase
MKHVLPVVADQVDALFQRNNSNLVTGLPTGFTDLDEVTSGMHGGELIVIAGRPSMGKTTFALDIVKHVALHAEKTVAVFSLEISRPQLTMRMLVSVGEIDQHKMRTGRLDDNDRARMISALAELHGASIHIDDTISISTTEMREHVAFLKQKCERDNGPKLGLIVVDSLQLVSQSHHSEIRPMEVAEIAPSLKSLAKEFDVPVIVVSRLNRKLEYRRNKRPMMADLYGSSSLEQSADVIMFIYRDHVYNPDSPDKGTAEIIISKHRNGPTGTIRLNFNSDILRFEDYTNEKLYDELTNY